MTFIEIAMLIGGSLMVLIGFMALASCRKVYLEAREDDRQALRATGEVIDLTEERPIHADGAATWHPVVEFQDRDGREHTFQARYGSTPPKWAVGDSIRVAYPPSKPAQARIDNRFMAYHSLLVALVIGFAFLGLGTGLVLVSLFHD